MRNAIERLLPSPAARRALAALCARYGVERLELFGSAARGEMRAGSDIDLVVRFHARPDMGPADQYFGLKEALERLFGRPVDLITARSLRNPYLRRSIEKEKVVLYAA